MSYEWTETVKGINNTVVAPLSSRFHPITSLARDIALQRESDSDTLHNYGTICIIIWLASHPRIHQQNQKDRSHHSKHDIESH